MGFQCIFFFLLNPILRGFGLSKAPVGIILCHCVKSHLKNKLLFKRVHVVGYWNAIVSVAVPFIHNRGKAETIDLVNILRRP